jgi:hypothetical protein
MGSSYQGKPGGTEKVGGMARPSRTRSHLPGYSPLASQAGRRVGPALYSLRPHWSQLLSYTDSSQLSGVGFSPFSGEKIIFMTNNIFYNHKFTAHSDALQKNG